MIIKTCLHLEKNNNKSHACTKAPYTGEVWRKATLGGISEAVGTIATRSHLWNTPILAEAHLQEPDMGLYAHMRLPRASNP